MNLNLIWPSLPAAHTLALGNQAAHVDELGSTRCCAKGRTAHQGRPHPRERLFKEQAQNSRPRNQMKTAQFDPEARSTPKPPQCTAPGICCSLACQLACSLFFLERLQPGEMSSLFFLERLQPGEMICPQHHQPITAHGQRPTGQTKCFPRASKSHTAL